jgi:hypothetical protein
MSFISLVNASVPVAHTVPVTTPVVRDTLTLVHQAFLSMSGKPVDLSKEGYYLDDKGSFEDVWNDNQYND